MYFNINFTTINLNVYEYNKTVILCARRLLAYRWELLALVH